MPGADWAEKREALGGFQTLQAHITQRSFLRAVTDIDRELATLRTRLEDIQARGYAFGGDIGAEIEAVGAAWAPVSQTVTEAAAFRAEAVAARLAELRSYADILDISEGVAAQIQANKLLELMAPLKAELATLSADVGQQVHIQARDVPDRVSTLAAWLDAAEATLRRAPDAGFDLRSSESIMLAIEADWRNANSVGEKDDDAVRGMLYLTDQRLIMEAHEWQGGILGLGGKKVQRVAWEGPYSALRAVSRKSSSNGEEQDPTIRVELAEPAPATEVELVVHGLPAALVEARLQNALLHRPEQNRWTAQVEAGETDERSA